jgi:putative effector of murein hydrolase
MIIGALSLVGLSFGEYGPAKDLMTWPLGPVTVALAVPLYKQRARLRRAAPSLVCGVVLGSATNIAVVLGLAAFGQLDRSVLGALAIKSITAPIAIELAKARGSDPSLVAALVIATGTLGAMLGPTILTRCGVGNPVARGIALGTTAHGQGTAAALIESETAGAMSSLAMAGAAIATASITPIYVPFLLGLLGY